MKIAFICTGNSARSQMAEAYAKHFAKLLGLEIEVYSAGSEPAQAINPLVIKIMAEDGIDLKDQYPKPLEAIPLTKLDLIITLCGDAKERCPLIPSAKREHWDLLDPAKVQGSEEEKLAIIRKIRDEVKQRVKSLLTFALNHP